jgi:hypothetical protein
MKTLVLAVLACFLADACLAQKSPAQKQHQQQWNEYVYPQDGFAITLPSTPNPHNDNGDRHINVYSVRMGTTVFTLRAVSRAMDCEAGLAEMWDNADSKDRRGEPVIQGTLKQVSLAGMKGLEYETDLGSGQRSLHRYHCADSRKFYIFNVGYQGKQRSPEVDRIIKSFHLVNPAHN